MGVPVPEDEATRLASPSTAPRASGSRRNDRFRCRISSTEPLTHALMKMFDRGDDLLLALERQPGGNSSGQRVVFQMREDALDSVTEAAVS
jgi:hypothetical protein